MSTRETITIVAPIADVGDAVMVPNYRANDRMERGTVWEAKYNAASAHASERWSYTIGLDRKGVRGTYLRLYVSDNFNAPRKL
jgi:hypothetical protein